MANIEGSCEGKFYSINDSIAINLVAALMWLQISSNFSIYMNVALFEKIDLDLEFFFFFFRGFISVIIVKDFHEEATGQVLYKKAVLKNFAIFTGKHLCWSLINLKGFWACITCTPTKRFQHRSFPVNIAKFLLTPFFIEHLPWLLLIPVKILMTHQGLMKFILL